MPLPEGGIVASSGEEMESLKDIYSMMDWGEEALKERAERSSRDIHRKLIDRLKENEVPHKIRRRITLDTLKSSKNQQPLYRAAREFGPIIKREVTLARRALRGLPSTEISAQNWHAVLDAIQESTPGVDPRIIQELKGLDPKLVAKHAPRNIVATVAQQRGRDPLLLRVFNKVTGRAGTPEVGPLAGPAKAAGGVPSKALAKTLGKAGVKGMGVGRRIARSALGGGTAVGLALNAILDGPLLYDILWGKKNRAMAMARSGIVPQTGAAATSAELVKHILDQQDTLAASRATAVTHEPKLTADVLRALSGGPPSKALTNTEMAFGSARQQGQLGPQREDVMEQMDRLLAELANTSY